MILIASILGGWLICGVFAYGITFADFQRSYPNIAKEKYREDLGFSVFMGVLGPLGLVAALITSGFAYNGLKWR